MVPWNAQQSGIIWLDTSATKVRTAQARLVLLTLSRRCWLLGVALGRCALGHLYNLQLRLDVMLDL